MMSATVYVAVDLNVRSTSTTCAPIAPITVAVQVQELSDPGCGICLGDGGGIYILQLVTMHVDPPPPPEPPPWIKCSPSTHVKSPICSATGSLGIHGGTNPRDREPAVLLFKLYYLGAIPVYGERIRYALRRDRKDAGRRILSHVAGEINHRQDVLCPKSRQ